MIKIAAFIRPKKKINQEILKLKKKVKKYFGKQPYLSHPPHCTIFTMLVSEKILKEKKFFKNLIITSSSKNEIKILKPAIFYNDPITGGKTMYFKIKKNSFLKILQTRLLQKFLYFRKINGNEKFKLSWMNLNVKKHGYPFIKSKWIPHFTISSIKNVKNENKFLTNFLKIKIKAKEIVKKIDIYKIKKDKHIYLWSINIKIK